MSSANGVASVVLMGLPTVTHGIDTTQRRLVLPITANAGGSVTVQVPSSNAAPAGHYYVIALDSRGVPSAAKIVQVAGSGGAAAAASVATTAAAGGREDRGRPRGSRGRLRRLRTSEDHGRRLTGRRSPAAVVSDRARP